MTVLDVAVKVALKVGLAVPDQLFASTAREHIELKHLINEAATDLADAYDWQALRGTALIIGNGVDTAFPLPNDYGRMLRTARVWCSRYLWAMRHIVDTDEWLGYLTVPYTQTNGIWTIFGNQFHILAAPGNEQTARYVYVSKNLVLDSTNAPKEGFTADADKFRLSEKLLALLTIYKWRDQKGQPTDGPAQDYNVALNAAIDKDGGSKPVMSDAGCDLGASGTWPGTIGGITG